MTKQVLEIEGMGCDHCVRAVREALEKVDGIHVEDVQIGTAVVTTSDALDGDRLEKAIVEAGYTLTNR